LTICLYRKIVQLDSYFVHNYAPHFQAILQLNLYKKKDFYLTEVQMFGKNRSFT